jgi:hypothetical protein
MDDGMVFEHAWKDLNRRVHTGAPVCKLRVGLVSRSTRPKSFILGNGNKLTDTQVESNGTSKYEIGL